MIYNWGFTWRHMEANEDLRSKNLHCDYSTPLWDKPTCSRLIGTSTSQRTLSSAIVPKTNRRSKTVKTIWCVGTRTKQGTRSGSRMPKRICRKIIVFFVTYFICFRLKSIVLRVRQNSKQFLNIRYSVAWFIVVLRLENEEIFIYFYIADA